jgi:hypothetical protein
MYKDTGAPPIEASKSPYKLYVFILSPLSITDKSGVPALTVVVKLVTAFQKFYISIVKLGL